MLAERIGPAELLELAGRRASRDFQVDPGRMPRLAETLVDGPAIAISLLDARVEIRHGPEQYPELQIRVSGMLQLACQRCLGGVMHAIELDFALTVVASDTEAAEVAEPFDCLVMSADGISVSKIIEDEILADLPMAPMHEASDADCVKSDAGQTSLSGTTASRPARSIRPFAELAAMMADGGKRRAD